MESGYFLPPLGYYWGCVKCRCSLWIGLIAVFVSGSIREHFSSTQVIVTCLQSNKEPMCGKLLHRFHCKQGRWEDNRNKSVWFTIPPPDVQVSLRQGFNWSEGARSHTLDTGDAQNGIQMLLLTPCLITAHRNTFTCKHKSPHACIQPVGDIPVSCSIFTPTS